MAQSDEIAWFFFDLFAGSEKKELIFRKAKNASWGTRVEEMNEVLGPLVISGR